MCPPYKRQKRHGEEKVGNHVTAKVNVGVMHPEAKESGATRSCKKQERNIP